MLHSLYLFKNVRITPDYSVVHDLSPEDWRTYLIGDSETEGQGDLVWQGDVNYYRLPDVIRIEGNYDDLRKATYGMISGNEEADPREMVIHNSMQRPMFFWVNDVRLLKQGCRVDLESQSRPWQKDYFDVVELSISVDVWSSNNGSFSLYDSYVERRHMDRWKNTGTEAEPVWEPIYYPNAAQGIEGAYQLETKQDVADNVIWQGSWSPSSSETPEDAVAKIFFVQINILDDHGKCKVYAFPVATINSEHWSYYVHVYENVGTTTSAIFVDLDDLLNGNLFTAISSSADFVQSITIYPTLSSLLDNVTFDARSTPPNAYITREAGTIGVVRDSVTVGTVQKSIFNLSYAPFVNNYRGSHIAQSKEMTVIAPDHTAIGEDEYSDPQEPMMYFMPARQRKVTSSFGGEIFTIPDIASLEKIVTTQGLSDLASGNVFIYLGKDIVRANALGACGVLECATLPIYNSAWKSYDAISKVSDTIMFNAKQMQTIGSGATSTALGGIGGFVQGGPAGAIAGVISGVVGTGLSYYGNEEELRAKQMQIKNSPCTMKSGGSGLGAVIKHMIGIFYITLKMDDQSMEKLRFMYYWYGYHVNRVFKGSIDLHTRSKFDFIKTSGAKVKGDLTAGAAKEIGAIFDKGVTIYHGPEGYALIGSGDMVANDEVNHNEQE